MKIYLTNGLLCTLYVLLASLSINRANELSVFQNNSHASMKLSAYSRVQSDDYKVGKQSDSCNLCGFSLALRDSRIIGGDDTIPSEFPWMVLCVQVYNNGEFHCGATLIGQSHVLTAAHCLLHKRNDVQVILGAHFLNSREIGVVSKSVSLFLIHPQFNPDSSKANDIAILKLESPVSFNRQIRPICLPTFDEEFIGKEGTVTGWGRTSINGQLSERLIKLRIPIVGEQDCRDKFYGTTLTNNTVCAGYVNGRKDSCIGDSGGPLISHKYRVWHLIGIVSWGASDSCALTFGVYTRITPYLDWIKKNTIDDYCLSSITKKTV